MGTRNDSLLEARLRRQPIRSQREACELAARQSIAAVGPVPEHEIGAVALGLATGLFGPAFDAADDAQKRAWVSLCEDAYRSALIAGLGEEER